MKKWKMWITSGVCMVLLLYVDQLTKKFAVAGLKDQPSIPIIKNVFELLYVENFGAAFGILQNQRFFFIVLTAVVLGGLLWLFAKIPQIKRYLPFRICLIGLCAGALGNLIDRIRLGYVVDFFYFKLIDFPVFNVADIYVVVFIACLAFLLLFYYKEEELDAILKKEKEGER